MHTFLKEHCKYEPEVPPIVYHYCSVDTLIKIIQNSCIWMSDANKMNDKEELKYFVYQMDLLLTNILDRYQEKYMDGLINIVRRFLKKCIEGICNGTSRIVRNSKQYICCFSQQKDSLDQWRAYGDDGKGVAIGFSGELLYEFNDGFNYDFLKIVYGNELKNKIETYMEENLLEILERYSEKEIDECDIEMDLSVVVIPILNERFAFKHWGFKSEDEWRLYCNQIGNFDEDDGMEDPLLRGAFYINTKGKRFSRSDLKIRSVNNDLCTYFELGFEMCKTDIIKEICIGPKCNIDKTDLEILLRKYKYIEDIDAKSIIISRSEIPYI